MVVLPTSESDPQTWRFTTTAPAGDGWTKPDFDATSWKSGPGGFGTRITPNTNVRTEWDTPDIWLRRSFTPAAAGEQTRYYVRIYHDEDAEVYLNGQRVTAVEGYITGYKELPLPADAMQAEENHLSVHCRQTGGGQYIDVGIIGLVPTE